MSLSGCVDVGYGTRIPVCVLPLFALVAECFVLCIVFFVCGCTKQRGLSSTLNMLFSAPDLSEQSSSFAPTFVTLKSVGVHDVSETCSYALRIPPQLLQTLSWEWHSRKRCGHGRSSFRDSAEFTDKCRSRIKPDALRQGVERRCGTRWEGGRRRPIDKAEAPNSTAVAA